MWFIVPCPLKSHFKDTLNPQAFTLLRECKYWPSLLSNIWAWTFFPLTFGALIRVSKQASQHVHTSVCVYISAGQPLARSLPTILWYSRENLDWPPNCIAVLSGSPTFKMGPGGTASCLCITYGVAIHMHINHSLHKRNDEGNWIIKPSHRWINQGSSVPSSWPLGFLCATALFFRMQCWFDGPLLS